MKSFGVLTALAATVAAVPAHHARHVALHDKRAVTWVTEVDFDVVTVAVTETVWADGSAPTPKEDPIEPNKHQQDYQQGPPTVSTVFVQPQTATQVAVTSVAPAPVPTTPSVVVVPTTPEPAPVYVAPTTSQAPAPAPAPSNTYVSPPPANNAPETYSSPAAVPAYGGSSDCNSMTAGSSCTGGFTHYAPGLGACGFSNTTNEAVFALDSTVFAAHTPNGNPNKNPLCGKKINIKAYDGTTMTATLVDACPGCTDMTHIDLSDGFWTQVSKGDPKADGWARGYTWTWQ